MDERSYDAVAARVRRFYSLAAEARWEDLAEILTEDFFIEEAASLPYPGVFRGVEGHQRLMKALVETWDDIDFSLDGVAVGENHATSLLTMTATARRTGRRMAVKICEVLRLSGERIASVTPYYYDTAAVAEAASGPAA